MIQIQDLLAVIGEIKGVWREKQLEFILDNQTLKFEKGALIRGSYFNESKSIIIYGATITDRNDLKEVILHEIGHHLNLDHKDIRH